MEHCRSGPASSQVDSFARGGRTSSKWTKHVFREHNSIRQWVQQGSRGHPQTEGKEKEGNAIFQLLSSIWQAFFQDKQPTEQPEIFKNLTADTESPYLSGYQKHVASGLAYIINAQQTMLDVLADLKESDEYREELDNALQKDLIAIKKNTGKRERNISVGTIAFH